MVRLHKEQLGVVFFVLFLKMYEMEEMEEMEEVEALARQSSLKGRERAIVMQSDE